MPEYAESAAPWRRPTCAGPLVRTAHGWSDGDYVIYSRESGSDDIGPEPGGWYVNVVDANTIMLYDTRVNAFAGGATGKQDLTAASAPGENHSLVLDVDNRPDFTVSGTSGDFDTDSCIFNGIRVITLTSAASIVGGFIQRSHPDRRNGEQYRIPRCALPQRRPL